MGINHPFKVHFQQSFTEAQQDFILVHGLEKKFKLHHHDIAQWMQKAWRKIMVSTIVNTWTHICLRKHVGLWNKTIYNKQHEQTRLMVEMKVLECGKTSEDSIEDSQQDDESDKPIIAENQGFLVNRIGQFKYG